MSLIDYQVLADKAVTPGYMATVSPMQIITVTAPHGETLRYLPDPDETKEFTEKIIAHMCDAMVKCDNCPE